MKRFIIGLIILFLAIVGISAFLFTQSEDINNSNNVTTNSSTINNSIGINSANNSSANNSSNINSNSSNDIVFTNHKGKTDKNKVTVTANCQKTAYQGTNASIIWKVTNNGNETIKNVVASSQIEVYNFGNIKPGETKIHEFTSYIPTNKDLEIDFDMKGGQWPGPLSSFGFSVDYSINGKNFSFRSNECGLDVKI